VTQRVVATAALQVLCGLVAIGLVALGIRLHLGVLAQVLVTPR
jgi:hypothetical protein